MPETERERVIRIADDRDEFQKMEDGFIYYWPHPMVGGALNSMILRWIADELDKRNEEWNRQIAKEFGS